MATLYRQPVSTFIAIRNKQVIGFACYDGTEKGMVGPTGVHKSQQNKGIASVLLNLFFEAMLMGGYVYAVIGWVSPTEFYDKSCDAIETPDSFPDIYARMISQS